MQIWLPQSRWVVQGSPTVAPQAARAAAEMTANAISAGLLMGSGRGHILAPFRGKVLSPRRRHGGGARVEAGSDDRRVVLVERGRRGAGDGARAVHRGA